ncbi:sigma-70 family RNA polymerase sigma factor [Coraliomargarita algicola]|uniref:Sigma-70 family RNA polymerase sigma factor n=1 Tax=Coraliomargarita algicola TaxID=3092156 RepID=A0ABZ0RPV9_9BACT|nr:sigma-70 family RNA polymerase sigma factor [Coraliomargarita sp. J2-16]WPJ97557.1 sigma-70 family RNA polymerase sigma factor [Coraliomargarita sp. J2-16]
MASTLTSFKPSEWVEQLAPRPRHMHTSSTAPSQPVEDIDSACLRALAEGDRAAFAQIVERWQTRLINFFYRATGNRADAEDLAQETFIELNRAAPRYQAQGTFNAFIFTLARRRLIDGYRKKARRPLEFVDPGEYFMQSQPEEIDQSREIEEAFHRALATLPDNQRNAILMLQQQGLSYEEIAQALDATVSAVKTWIHRARTHLRHELKDIHQQD